MANTSRGAAHWEGSTEGGVGTISAESSQIFTEVPYNFKARAESQAHITTPEELLGAAHAACFSMALSLILGQKGFEDPVSVDTTADVTFAITKDGPAITGIKLINHSVIPGISEADFQEVAELTEKNCPVSKALAGVPITLEATLG